MQALIALVGLASLAAAAPTPGPACPAGGHPPVSQSKGFTLVVNVTDLATDLEPSVQGYTLSTIHDGAGQAVAGLYNDSAPVWYLNGTDADIKDKSGSIIMDGGTPPFPMGIDVLAAKDGVSSVRVDAGPGTPGVQLATDRYTYVTAPKAGTYAACREPLAYYGGREFLVLKHAEGDVPEGCAEIKLLPQCAELEALPEGAISSHEFARDVDCYEDVSSIKWE